MSVTVIGTCGNCGGSVEAPTVWMGIYPPVPKCRQCGAYPKDSSGPRIEMEPIPTLPPTQGAAREQG